jgi:YD repeat-containing protein
LLVLRSDTGAGSSPTSFDTVAAVYDSLGRTLKQSNPYAGDSSGNGSPAYWTTNTYDELSRVTRVTLPDNQTIQTAYTGASPGIGATVIVTDQVGRQRKSEVDGLGRLAKVIEQNPATGSLDPTNYLTSYTYDMLDNLKTVNQGTQARTFVYDGLSRVTSQTTPEAGTVTFTYTSFSAVQTKTDARGVITTYGYDALNRPQTVSYNTSAAPLVAATAGVTIAYKTTAPGKGQVSSVTDGLGSETYAFDPLGRVSSKTRTIDTRSYQTQYLYNNANQMTHLIYPSGKRVRVNRDTRGRMSGMDRVDGFDNVLGTYVTGVTYRVEGMVSGLSLGNGVNESYGYSNDRLQMTSQTATKGSTLMSLNYSYAASAGASGVGTAAGNSGQLMSIAAGSTINGQLRPQGFTCDTVGRLATATGVVNVESKIPIQPLGQSDGHDDFGDCDQLKHAGEPELQLDYNCGAAQITRTRQRTSHRVLSCKNRTSEVNNEPEDNRLSKADLH